MLLYETATCTLFSSVFSGSGYRVLNQPPLRLSAAVSVQIISSYDLPSVRLTNMSVSALVVVSVV